MRHTVDTSTTMAAEPSMEQNFMSLLEQKGYTILSKIGEGTYSTVYHAYYKNDSAHVAIKVLKPTLNPERIANEIRILTQLRDVEYVIKLFSGERYQSYVALIFEYFNGIRFEVFFVSMSVDSVRQFMRCLLQSLRAIHAHEIVHNDIKPDNCLFNPINGRFRLIDFGLAEKVSEMQSTDNSRRGTRGFRAPEIILSILEKQGVAADVWSAGAILLCILSGRYPFFFAPDNLSSLAEIATLVGMDAIRNFCKKHGVEIEASKQIDMDPVVRENGGSLKAMCQQLNFSSDVVFPDEAYDLVERMLRVDPDERITTHDALKHPFLQPEIQSTQST